MRTDNKPYLLDREVTTTISYLQDVERLLLRSALAGGVTSNETRTDMIHKLNRAAESVSRMPLID